ncbi:MULTISPECIES: DNA adenine methylase [Tenuifilum]|jgi:adenine-specific DNA-methyltransferase|uniref:DNA adenine methylase n=1 Tax=Tenuifilum TaxID=2760873 RepID=UPI0024AAB1FE|nr:DNA adenine methylase [Tenuifilum sp.]MDI3527585.1 adenine-specific DNA-methyltransferase [Tenuifilum sp.]
MDKIGTYLKETREALALQLQEVHSKTKIDPTVLSRIENGKRLPTKKQLLQLAELYNCDTHKILVHWLSDKVVSEIKYEDFGLEALQVAEEKIVYGKPISLFPELKAENYINLESRRYIGSKAKLTNWIIETILKETKDAESLIDIFAGTASVAKAASEHFPYIIINDILHANNIIYKAFFKPDYWDREKVEDILEYYNSINPNDLEENYFSENYGDKFFDHLNAKLIGYIREDIESRKNSLTDKEYSVILTSLIYNIDKIANTVGHFDAYIKKPIKYKKLNLRLIKPVDIKNVEIYQENANLLARKISADIAYIDPPYNSRQYSRFYHVYENLVKWDKPPLFGVALKPEPENMSVYCTVNAKAAFRDLIENLDVKYIAVSYNNTYNSKSNSSENKIRLETIEDILKKKGKTKVFECSHRFFNTGKTEFDNHKELLFITKVNGN